MNIDDIAIGCLFQSSMYPLVGEITIYNNDKPIAIADAKVNLYRNAIACNINNCDILDFLKRDADVIDNNGTKSITINSTDFIKECKFTFNFVNEEALTQISGNGKICSDFSFEVDKNYAEFEFIPTHYNLPFLVVD
jgi:hypothetical protein